MIVLLYFFFFFFSSRRRHTRLQGDWSSDVCSSDLDEVVPLAFVAILGVPTDAPEKISRKACVIELLAAIQGVYPPVSLHQLSQLLLKEGVLQQFARETPRHSLQERPLTALCLPSLTVRASCHGLLSCRSRTD